MKRLNVILGKKQLVAAGLTVLLGTAVAVNFIYSGGKDKKLTEPRKMQTALVPASKLFRQTTSIAEKLSAKRHLMPSAA